jgi:thymidylate synthase
MTNREAAAEEYASQNCLCDSMTCNGCEGEMKKIFFAAWDAAISSRQPEIDRLKEAIDKLKVAYDLLRESADR